MTDFFGNKKENFVPQNAKEDDKFVKPSLVHITTNNVVVNPNFEKEKRWAILDFQQKHETQIAFVSTSQ